MDALRAANLDEQGRHLYSDISIFAMADTSDEGVRETVLGQTHATQMMLLGSEVIATIINDAAEVMELEKEGNKRGWWKKSQSKMN